MSSMAPTGSSSIVYTMNTIIIQHNAKHFSDLRDLRSSSTPTDLTIRGKDGSIGIHKKAIQLNSSNPSETIEKRDAIQFLEFTVTELLKVRNYAYFGSLELPEEDMQRFVIIAEAFRFDALHQLLIRALNPEDEAVEIQNCQDTEIQESQETEIQTQDSFQATENGSTYAASQLTLNWKEPVVSLTRLNHSEYFKYMEKSKPLLTNVSRKCTRKHLRSEKMTQQMLKWWLEEIDKGRKYFPGTLLAKKFAAEGHTVHFITLQRKKDSLIALYKDHLKGVDVPQIKPFLGYLRQIESKNNFIKIHHWKWSSAHVKQFLRLWLKSKDMKKFPAKSIAAKLNQLGINVSYNAVKQKKRELLKMYLNHKKGKNEPKIKPFISLLRQIHSG